MKRNSVGRIGLASAAALFLAGCQSGSSTTLTANDLYPRLAEAGVDCDSESVTSSGVYSGASEAICDSSTLGRFTVVVFPDPESMASGLQSGVCPSTLDGLTSFGDNYFVLFYPPRETLDAVSEALGGETGTAQDLCASL